MYLPDSSQDGVWALSQLGNVINAYVDREINKPTNISNTTGYFIGDDGRMYARGETVPSAMPPKQPVNGMLLLLVLGAVIIAVNK